jgi:hypothetical protein
MQISPQRLADRLIQEGGRVVDFFNLIYPEQWSTQIYPDQSTWTIKDLLAHFVSAEIGRRALINDIQSGGNGAPEEFSIDRFNQREVELLKELSSEGLINQFKTERSKLAEMVASYTIDDLNKVGNDPYLGPASLSEIIQLTYRHLQIHMREVRQYLK